MSTEITLAPSVREQDIPRMLGRKANKLELDGARLTYHPFAGFQFMIPAPYGIRSKAYVLVDYFTGKAFLSGEWEQGEPAPEAARVADPDWNTIDTAEALERAHALIRAARLKRAKLAMRQDATVERAVDRVWKPNWLVNARHEDTQFQLLVDGLSGKYFIVGG